jgi:glyoxylase-like metal-dependent hydrolase (beta-lactamase superfamily II)
VERDEILPGLHVIRLRFGQVYLWNDDGELTLIDTGLPGAADEIAAAISSLGLDRSALRRVVLTHFHNDHSGSAADLATWGDVEVLAGAADAPIIRGDVPGPPPVLTEEEKPLYDAIVVRPKLPPAPPCRVDRELNEGDRIAFGGVGGARVLSIPGHTEGSIAVYVEEPGVLFTGDTIANPQGRPILGVFNLDREQTIASMRRLASLDASVVCFGHGDPLVSEASAALRTAAEQLPA